ncbi:unnamed protein product [Lactuca saligna]|uniref:SAC9 first GBDL domain-containing protein n=1 Tax=Lactuca saligna TaxID=75948 RepID=A0AA35YG95_LACSI|nr:unnamed protein product [Lactuca saligna]
MFAPSSHLLSATSGHLFPPATSAHLFPPTTLGSPHVTGDYNDCSTLQALSTIKPTVVLHISNFLPSHGPSIRSNSPKALPLADPCIPSRTYLRHMGSLHCKKAPSPSSESPSGILNGESLKLKSIADFDLFFKRRENYGMLNKGVLSFLISSWVPGAGPTVKKGLSIGSRCNGSLYPSWRALSCLSASCADSSTYPSRVDVRIGCDLDGLKLVVEGASIPECANGTSIVIPIPGAVSDEDMVVTGAGARVHDQDTTKLPFLYDFKKLEGKLDFLTCVVVLTFYPAVSARTPITLGEVPYIDNFTSHHLTLFVPRFFIL